MDLANKKLKELIKKCKFMKKNIAGTLAEISSQLSEEVQKIIKIISEHEESFVEAMRFIKKYRENQDQIFTLLKKLEDYKLPYFEIDYPKDFFKVYENNFEPLFSHLSFLESPNIPKYYSGKDFMQEEIYREELKIPETTAIYGDHKLHDEKLLKY
jgi:hypothetical protein